MIDLYAIPTALVDELRRRLDPIIPQAQQHWSASPQAGALRCHILWCTQAQHAALHHVIGESPGGSSHAH